MTPVSITATVTPLPVEYCHALLTFSIVKPGAGNATFGSATVIVRAQMLLCRIGWSGCGGPSGGTSDGSTDGDGTACADGALAIIPVSNTTIAVAAIRSRTVPFDGTSLLIYGRQHGGGKPDGLVVGLGWFVPGMLLATGYTVFVYRQFSGKVKPEVEGY